MVSDSLLVGFDALSLFVQFIDSKSLFVCRKMLCFLVSLANDSIDLALSLSSLSSQEIIMNI